MDEGSTQDVAPMTAEQFAASMNPALAELTQVFGDPISVYSRAQAIEDGVLVDVTEWVSADKGFGGGFRLHVAVTSAVWANCVEWTADDERRHRVCNDERGRAHDVLYMCSLSVRRSSGDRCRFSVVRVPREGRGRLPRRVDLVAVCGPDDDGSPCITIMLDGED
jgi:hypothetical protein